MDPIDSARKGDVNFLKGVSSDILLNTTDKDEGDSVLSVAAKNNHLDCCEEICRRCPSLLYHQNKTGNTALHHAVQQSGPEMVKFFINAEHDIEMGGRISSNKKLLTMVNRYEETALHLAVKNQSVEKVKLLIEADPTAEYYTNESRMTPLFLAMREAKSSRNTDISLSLANIRKLLLVNQPSQAKIGVRSSGWTALHIAASAGDLAAVEDFIQFCPDCLDLVDNYGHNFLHIAVVNQHSNVVVHALGRREVGTSVLNAQDEDGKTPLHLAALNGDDRTILSLLYDPRVDKNVVNKDGTKAIDMINFEYDKARAGIFGMRKMSENEMKDQSDFDLVVGALIATVSFTAGLTVPGGYISNEGPNQGTAVLSKKAAFVAFVIFNNFALMFSLYAVFSHFCTRRSHKKEDIIEQLNLATICTLGAIFALMAAFVTGSYVVLASSNGLAIVSCVHCCCFFVFAFHVMWRLVPLRFWRIVRHAELRRTQLGR